MPYLDEGNEAIIWNKLGEAYPPPNVTDRVLNGDRIQSAVQDLNDVLSGEILQDLDYGAWQDEFGGIFGSIGKALKGGVKGIAKAGRSVGKTLGKVPVVGKGLKGVFDLTANAPFQVAGKIASGERLDRVALSTLQNQIKSVQGVAPYAQAVLSVVPVVGPGINAGLSTGLALASGRPLTAAIMAGVRASLPGGPLAAAAFDAGKAAVEGKGISSVALAALPVGAAEKRAIAAGLDAAGRIAKGQRVDAAVLAQADKAMALLPPEARTALKAGVAVAQGQNLQKIALTHVTPGFVGALQGAGVSAIKGVPALVALGKPLSAAGRAGLVTAVGLLANSPRAPLQVVAVRAQLHPEQRAGFDQAVAAYAAKKREKRAATPAPAARVAPRVAAPAAPCKCPAPIVFLIDPSGKVTRKAS